MARKTKAPAAQPLTDVSVPTMMRTLLPGGKGLGVDGSLWLFRKVPLEPVVDAKSIDERVNVFTPLMAAYDELAALSHTTSNRRVLARKDYRQTQMLMVNLKKMYNPATGHPIAGFLKESFPHQVTEKRLLLLAIKLSGKLGGNGGLRHAIESFTETLVVGGTPLSDYDTDLGRVDAAMARCGLSIPSSQEIAVANSWWNQGHFPDTVDLPHSDHLHVFADAKAVRMADAAGREDCHSWPAIPNHRTLTVATLEGFEFDFASPTSTAAHWATGLVEDGAVAISIRAQVEPAKITRAELRRQRKRYLDDINERIKQNKMELSEQDEMVHTLEQVEGVYASREGSPTLVDASVLIAFDGEVEDITQAGADSAANLRVMNFRQRQALAEMMLCSHITANPNLHDMPTQNVAASGIQSLSTVGDKTGALIGFTERDRQPAYVSPTAASTADGLPLMLVAGGTGSGKATRLSTRVPTPSGWTTMGALELGDEVLGRDGKPCSVTYISPVNENPELYKITLSDGQIIEADANHQWVVSAFQDRKTARSDKRRAALDNWSAARRTIAELESLAAGISDGHESTIDDLFELIKANITRTAWKSPVGVYAALRMVDCPFRTTPVETQAVRTVRSFTKTDPVQLFPVKASLAVLQERWGSMSGLSAARWGKAATRRAEACTTMLLERTDTDMATVPQILRDLVTFGAEGAMNPAHARAALRAAGVVSVAGTAQVSLDLPSTNTTRPDRSLYPTAVALKSLALRVGQQYADEPTLIAGEHVMSTAEILDGGIRLDGGHANYAIRLAKPLDLPAADLPIDPYVMGAWLGDGSSSGGQIASSAVDSCTGEDGLTDQDHMLAQIRPHYEASLGSAEDCIVIGVKKLVTDLRTAGVLNNKHIPDLYLRASREQRLALLQGLMDTDGTIDSTGSSSIDLCHKPLSDGVLELIRSLGIKCTMTSGEAAYTLNGVRKVTGTRYRMKFTTDQIVFRLPRKAARLPYSLRETSGWNYIESIEAVKPEPARCITVDSADSTYLVEDFVPTHNTQALLWLATQMNRIPGPRSPRSPQVIVDPKTESDHSPTVLAAGGQVISLDDLQHSDGIFDPIRFAKSRDVGVELAASMLGGINPWGERKGEFEVAVYTALRYGVSAGAECTGQALTLALAHGKASKEMVQPILDLAEASPMFRACVGMNPGSQALNIFDGITLIKVGNSHLDLPEPGAIQGAPIMQRVCLALVRMMVFGSAMALTGRGGVIHLDEAWVFLGAGKAEVERLGRLARSQGVLPVLYTQRVSDALKADLTGYISRGFILPIEDKIESEAACRLFNLEPTPERLGRIRAKAIVGEGESQAPNRNSMRALRDPRTNQVIRGAIGIYADLTGRAVPVEVVLPPTFLTMASTNPEDIRRRMEAATAVLV